MLVSSLLYALIFNSLVSVASLGSGRSQDEVVNFSLSQEYSLEVSDQLEDSSQARLSVANIVDKVPATPTISLKAKPTTVWRPRDIEAVQYARSRSLKYSESVPVEWEEVEILGPDVEDRHTLGQMARMTGNAYALPGQKNWYDIDEAWNTVRPVQLYSMFYSFDQ